MKFFTFLPQSMIVVSMLLLNTYPLQGQTMAFTRVQSKAPEQKPVRNTKMLKSALKEIERRYKVSFSYDRNTVEDKHINVDSARFHTLHEELDHLLQPLNLHFEKLDSRIYLILPGKNKAPEAENFRRVSSSGLASIQTLQGSSDAATNARMARLANISIQGRVTSSDGAGLPGVSVMLKGTSTGTATGMDGRYQLTVPDGGGILVFSYMGFANQEAAISDRTTIDVMLVPDPKTMGEVVVVGYGTQQRKDLTGAIASISGKELSRSAVVSVDQALQGKVSGVYVTSNSGEPGGGLSVRVRGMGGFGGSEPLYVVDGVIITYSDNSTSNNPLATLNMADIASINILKDASASAIYGARAGNGVVIITTKRGQTGKPRVTLDAYYGFQKVVRQLDLMNAAEYASFSNESRVAAGQPVHPGFTNPSALGEGTDWQDAIFRTAPTQNYAVSVSGGSEKSQYFISGSYLSQDGIIIGSKFNRYSLRINLDNQVTDRIKFGNSLTLSRTHNMSLTNGNGDKFSGIVAQAIRRSPTLPIYNADGSWAGPDATDRPIVGDIPNPLRVAITNNNPNERLRALGNVYGELLLAPGLSFRSNLGIDYILTNFNRFRPSYVEGVLQNNIPEAFSSKSTLANVLSENTLNYKKRFGKQHNLEVLAGYTAQQSTYENVNALSLNHLTNTVITVDAGATTGRLAGGNKSQTSYVSYLARINYAFADRYLFTANVRRDGSSVFSSQNKYAVFPSFSAGWRISEEGFMQDASFISNLKLRGSWGQVGIDGSLGTGAEYATIAAGYLYNFGGTPVSGMAANRIPNGNLKWETVTQSDVGLDIGLFDDRVSVNMDYFVKRYTDMITQKIIPLYGGIVSDEYYTNIISQPVNSATVNNKGFEFALNYQDNKGDFSYNLGVNLTTFTNKVIRLDDDIVGGGTGNTPQGNLTRTVEDRSVGEFYGFVTDGIFQSAKEVTDANALGDPGTPFISAGTAPGDIKFRDLNGDHVINDDDKTFIGSPIPDFTYGLNAGLSYKQFDLNIFFQGVQGNKIVNVNRFITESSTGTENKSTAMLQRWTASNPGNIYPRATNSDPNFNDRFSDRFVEDGSYLRLRNLQLGYKLPASALKRLFLSTVRIFVSAENLFTITKYKGFNPDIGAQNQQNINNGLDNTIYPQSITFLGGFSVAF